MGTRSSIEEGLKQAHEIFEKAKKQMDTYRKQEHYNQTEYTEAQTEISDMLRELDVLGHSGNPQQKEQVYRAQLQLRQLLNDMVLDQNNILH
ncbi:DUF2524 family protein [Bacillus tianshenii]|nr:DUF2524 family protein [Bacillus tianshenii]